MTLKSTHSRSTFLKQLILLKTKFATTSALATGVDWLLYTFLADKYFSKVVANIISRAVGMVINFFMQKKLVFDLNRKLSHAFYISIAVSLIGLVLGTMIIYLIGNLDIWQSHPYLKLAPKVIETGIIFFFNFYMKRFAFEKRFL